MTEQEQINSDKLLELRVSYQDLLERYGQLEDEHMDCSIDEATFADLEFTVDSLTAELKDLEASLALVESAIGLSETITFENSHEVAYHLYHRDAEAARALFEELKYWIKDA